MIISTIVIAVSFYIPLNYSISCVESLNLKTYLLKTKHFYEKGESKYNSYNLPPHAFLCS